MLSLGQYLLALAFHRNHTIYKYRRLLLSFAISSYLAFIYHKGGYKR